MMTRMTRSVGSGWRELCGLGDAEKVGWLTEGGREKRILDFWLR